MNYHVNLSERFKRSMKRLAKKHLSIIKDVHTLIDKLKEEPHTGILIKENTYKIRMTISSKGKGKSGGARVITYVVDEKEEIVLLDIYDKSDQDSISDNDLQNLIDELND